MSSPGEYALDNELRGKKPCSRCGSTISPNVWHDNWPNYGRIELGFAAQAFAALCQANNIAETEHFNAWKKGHKAMAQDDSQAVTFEWGRGYKYSNDEYILCYKCQKVLLGVVGEFFNYGEFYTKKSKPEVEPLKYTKEREEGYSCATSECEYWRTSDICDNHCGRCHATKGEGIEWCPDYYPGYVRRLIRYRPEKYLDTTK